MPVNEPSPPADESSDTAGAYGFRRRELIALLAVAIFIIGITVIQWWQRSEAQAGRQWTVQDVYIDTLLLAVENRPVVRPAESTADRGEAAFTLVDVNTANEEELMRIPGIGPALAERIVVSRALEGPFRSVEDLQRVHGIGEKTAARVSTWVRFSDPVRITDDSAGATP